MITGRDVTVVIPTIAGREALLDRALASVLRQQVAPGHVIVQRDETRAGAASCRNAALEHVTTDWVALLDDDDEMLPNHLKVLVRGANRSHADLVFSYAEFIGGRDPLACCDDQGLLVPEPLHVAFGPMQERWLRERGNFIPATVLVRTALVRQVGGYPQPHTFAASVSRDCEDYGLLLRLLDAGAHFYHVRGVRTWRYHFHDANTGGRGLINI